MKKSAWIWILSLLAVAIIGGIIYHDHQKNKWILLRLPKDSDPSTFGPYYWKALHRIMSEIPCSSCRPEAEKIMVFVHDLVNKKLGKPLYNPENFDYYTQKIAAMA